MRHSRSLHIPGERRKQAHRRMRSDSYLYGSQQWRRDESNTANAATGNSASWGVEAVYPPEHDGEDGRVAPTYESSQVANTHTQQHGAPASFVTRVGHRDAPSHPLPFYEPPVPAGRPPAPPYPDGHHNADEILNTPSFPVWHPKRPLSAYKLDEPARRLAPDLDPLQPHLSKTEPPQPEPGGSCKAMLDSADAERGRIYPPFTPPPSIPLGIERRKSQFFVVGRVFHMVDNIAGGETESVVSSWTQNSFGQKIYTKPRRFIVVQSSQRHSLCVPIMTYRGQGVSRRGVTKSDHCIVYTSSQPPTPLPNELPGRDELGMEPTPIRVDPDDNFEALDPMSRINLAAPVSVNSETAARGFGQVASRSLDALEKQFEHVMSAPRGIAARAAASSADDSPLRKRLRDVSDLMAKATLARTQQLELEQNLQAYQRHLLRSMEGLASQFAPLIQNIPAPTEMAKTVSLRPSLLTEQARGRRSLSPATSDRPHPGVTSSFAMRADAASTTASTESMQPLSGLVHQYRLDLNSARATQSAFEESSQLLIHMEFRLKTMIDALLVDFRDPESVAKIQEQLSEQTEGSLQHDDAEFSDDGLPSIVGEYFSKVGDVGVFRDRLLDLDFRHEESKLTRDFIADRGDPLEVSEEDFQHKYRQRRSGIESDLQAASDQAEALRVQCEKEGFDPEQYRTAKQSDTASALDLLPTQAIPSPFVAPYQFSGPDHTLSGQTTFATLDDDSTLYSTSAQRAAPLDVRVGNGDNRAHAHRETFPSAIFSPNPVIDPFAVLATKTSNVQTGSSGRISSWLRSLDAPAESTKSDIAGGPSMSPAERDLEDEERPVSSRTT